MVKLVGRCLSTTRTDFRWWFDSPLVRRQASKLVTSRKADGAVQKKKKGRLGRLIGRIEEGKGAAYASPIDVRCSDRNRIISNRSILIATGGSAIAEMAMKYSSFGLWISRAWLAFMDESQQYGNYHEIAAFPLAIINTASKHLHNDLARAIKALEQKKP